MGRLSAGAALAAVLVFAGCGSASRTDGISVHVDRDPFRIEVSSGGEHVVSQEQAARLRYQLASSGNQHTLTKVLSSRGDVYQVATDEPGRTATVAVTRR